MLRTKRAKILGVVGILAVILAISGIALMRGYLIRFNLNGERISREAFYEYSNEAKTATQFTLGCAQGDVALGWLYIFEVNCFATQAGVDAYMAARYPR